MVYWLIVVRAVLVGVNVRVVILLVLRRSIGRIDVTLRVFVTLRIYLREVSFILRDGAEHLLIW